jgi:hypothetical protein
VWDDVDPDITDEQCEKIVAEWREAMQPKNDERLTEVQAVGGGVGGAVWCAVGGGVGGAVEWVVEWAVEWVVEWVVQCNG